MNDTDKENLLTEMFEAVKGSVFSLDGPAMVVVLQADKTYRNKNVLSMDCFPLRFWLSAARGPIFSFEPEDPQDFASLDVTLKNVDACFPMLLEELWKWAAVKFKMKPSEIEMQPNDFESFYGVVTALEDLEIEKLQAEGAISDINDPIFGMF